jgi:hypothetical protein
MFQPIDLIWNDKAFTIAPTSVLGAIAVIEEHFTFQDLADATKTKKFPLSKLSRVYGAVLRYAGATVTDDEVYIGMFSGNMTSNVSIAVNTLLAMMIPPSAFAEAAEPKAGGAARGNARSSKRRIKH